MLYLVLMFVRQKKNASGKISVQVINKTSGKYRVVHTVGCSADPDDIDRMIADGMVWIKHKTGRIELDFTNNHQEKNLES